MKSRSDAVNLIIDDGLAVGAAGAASGLPMPTAGGRTLIVKVSVMLSGVPGPPSVALTVTSIGPLAVGVPGMWPLVTRPAPSFITVEVSPQAAAEPSHTRPLASVAA